ncbi:hypothetical protein VTJ04DRAFT_6345 [Mycothermus thermophilus]|uniref:uncharacterized protein n=1 Tax=Humicola insolens TaxID=85995 RepID=UPI003742828D
MLPILTDPGVREDAGTRIESATRSQNERPNGSASAASVFRSHAPCCWVVRMLRAELSATYISIVCSRAGGTRDKGSSDSEGYSFHMIIMGSWER